MPAPGSMRWKPLLNNVLVYVDAPELVTEAGIILPELPDGVYSTGTVIEAGPGTYAENGTIAPCLLKPGDRVMILLQNSKRSAVHPTVTIDGVDLLRLRDVDVYFVLRDENEPDPS
jgi:co-chaperonin GroES (HSP10)